MKLTLALLIFSASLNLGFSEHDLRHFVNKKFEIRDSFPGRWLIEKSYRISTGLMTPRPATSLQSFQHRDHYFKAPSHVSPNYYLTYPPSLYSSRYREATRMLGTEYYRGRGGRFYRVPRGDGVRKYVPKVLYDTRYVPMIRPRHASNKALLNPFR
jgi:hypothetical protein